MLASNRLQFRHPCNVDPQPRTALLLPGFKRTGAARIFSPVPGSEVWLQELRKYAPASLAGSLRQLLFIASMRAAYSDYLESVNHSLVVIFQAEQPWLSDRDRDELWDAFGLPVYEQIYCATGLLASECEAHDGLHTAKGAEWTTSHDGELWFREPPAWWEERGESYAPTGLFGRVNIAPCACGRKTSRIHVLGPGAALLATEDLSAFAEVA